METKKETLYIIEIKHSGHSAPIYLDWIDNDSHVHITFSKKCAGQFNKQALARIYECFGRDHVIRHSVKEVV